MTSRFPSRTSILAKVIGVAIAGLLVYRFIASPSEEKRIEILIQNLTRSASFEGSVHPLEQLGYGRTIAKHLASDLTVKIAFTDDEQTFHLNTTEATQKLAALRNQLEQLAISVSNLSIRRAEDTAVVTLVARAMGRDPGRSDYFLEEHPVKLSLKKHDDEWMITAAENLDVIE